MYRFKTPYKQPHCFVNCTPASEDKRQGEDGQIIDNTVQNILNGCHTSISSKQLRFAQNLYYLVSMHKLGLIFLGKPLEQV